THPPPPRPWAPRRRRPACRIGPNGRWCSGAGPGYGGPGFAGLGMRAAVMGAGSWGTTFAQVLCDAGTSTVLYARRPELTKALRELHENPDYLPGITLTSVLEATSDAVSALDGADIVAFAVPAQSLRSNLLEWKPLIPAGALLVSLIKGIELGTRQRMSEGMCEGLGADPARVAG